MSNQDEVVGLGDGQGRRQEEKNGEESKVEAVKIPRIKKYSKPETSNNNSTPRVKVHPDDLADLDSLSHEQVLAQLRAIKRSRKTSEEDVKLLSNRINHLEHEYKTTMKKVNDTKERITQIKRQRDLRLNRSESLKDRRENSLVVLQGSCEKSKHTKEEARRRRQEAIQRKLREKQRLTQQFQEERKRILEEKKLTEEALKREKEQKRKKRLEEVRRKKEREAEQEEKRLHKLRLQKAKKLEKEAEVCRAREEEIKALEEMELKLIQELRQAQAEQNGAYKELEETLAEEVAL